MNKVDLIRPANAQRHHEDSCTRRHEYLLLSKRMQIVVHREIKAAIGCLVGTAARRSFGIRPRELPEIEWFANITNPRTRRAYEIDLKDFMAFVGIQRPEEF